MSTKSKRRAKKRAHLEQVFRDGYGRGFRSGMDRGEREGIEIGIAREREKWMNPQFDPMTRIYLLQPKPPKSMRVVHVERELNPMVVDHIGNAMRMGIRPDERFFVSYIEPVPMRMTLSNGARVDWYTWQEIGKAR